MTATTSSSSATVIPSVDASYLASGLFTDLAPLLALFGDEVTKQYLTVSLGAGDAILLAIAPLGIITIIVCAIRVSGYPWMKMIIGRSRDSPDDEEKEVLSSTSHNVREIWNGHRVIRQCGEPQTTELVIQDTDEDCLMLQEMADLLDFSESRDLVIRRLKKGPKLPFSHNSSYTAQENRLKTKEGKSNEIEDIIDLIGSRAPNLTLNTPDAIPNPICLWTWVAVGAALQGLVFFFNAYVFYHLHWLRDGSRVAAYGFPLWACGTLSVTVGLFLCGYAIDRVTTEYVVTPGDGKIGYGIVRFQKAIPSMNLPAYAFLHRDSRVLISQRTVFPGIKSASELAENGQGNMTGELLELKGDVALLTLIGAGTALAGFILQNLGIRELHFSASIAQLGATVALTVIRSWIRRKVGNAPPNCKRLNPGWEVVHMLYELCKLKRLTTNAKIDLLETTPEGKLRLNIASCTPPPFEDQVTYQDHARRLLNSHRNIVELQPEQNRKVVDKAKRISEFISSLQLTKKIRQRILFCGPTPGPCSVERVVNSQDLEGSIDFEICASWYQDYEMVAALWSFSLHEYYESNTQALDLGTELLALHIVAVCTIAEYEERYKYLQKYMDKTRLYIWRMDANRKLTLMSAICEQDFDTSHSRLFGLHHIEEKSDQGSIIITFHNENYLYEEHLIADFISNYLFQALPDWQADTTEIGRLTKSCVTSCGLGGEMALIAIIPAFLHYGIPLPEPKQKSPESNDGGPPNEWLREADDNGKVDILDYARAWTRLRPSFWLN